MKDPLAHVLQQTEESYKGIHQGEVEKAAGWEKWYAQWLLTLSDLQELLGRTFTVQELEELLLTCDQIYLSTRPAQPWSEFVAMYMREHSASHGVPEK